VDPVWLALTGCAGYRDLPLVGLLTGIPLTSCHLRLAVKRNPCRCPDSLDGQKGGKKAKKEKEAEQLFSMKTIHNNFPFMAADEGYCRITERGAHMH
jgi:hypothetical protein